jgi:soluble lytic murein transglycosylase-like protein
MKRGGLTAALYCVIATSERAGGAMAPRTFARPLCAAVFLSLLLGSSVPSCAQPLAPTAPGAQNTQAASSAPAANTTSNAPSANATANANEQAAQLAPNLEPAPMVPVTNSNAICPILEEVARENALPLNFFARLIWQESHFRPDVVGPITRYGERARGIAQFMPTTAAARGLLDAFDPREALPKSGEFLAQLRNEFGNLGLAAAAYNAGPQRVREFLAGARGLPEETRHYILAITGHPIEDWVGPTRQVAATEPPREGELTANCDDLEALLKRPTASQMTVARTNVPAVTQVLLTGMPRDTQVSQRRVPSWCAALHRPNASMCGSVHARGPVPVLGAMVKPQHHHAEMIRASW